MKHFFKAAAAVAGLALAALFLLGMAEKNQIEKGRQHLKACTHGAPVKTPGPWP